MKNKTYRFAAVAAVLLAFCLVFMAPVGAAGDAESTSGVAKVGEEYYSTLHYAVDNITTQSTIVVLKDVTLSTSLEIPEGKTIILDLNGHNVSMTDSSSTASYMIKNNGVLTIKDNSSTGTGVLSFLSTTPSSSYSYSTSTVGNAGTLTVESGTIESLTSSGASYAIDNYWYTNDVVTNINGGKITAKTRAIRQVPFSTTHNNTLNINGGVIRGGNAAVQTHAYQENTCLADVKITGGELTGIYAYMTYYSKNEGHANTSIDISGGTLNGTVFIYNSNVDSSNTKFKKVSITDGTFNGGVYVYTKDNIGNAVGIESITGGTFSDPYVVDYLGENTDVTIKLSEDVKLDSSLIVDKAVKLDLNGHSLIANTSCTDDSLVIVKREGVLTVEDSSAKETGSITANAGSARIAVKMTMNGETDTSKVAKLIVNSGTINGSSFGISGNGNPDRINTEVIINGGAVIGSTGIYHPQDGKLTINGGTVTGETGIEMRAGSLTVTGGEIIGTVTPTETSPNGSGTTTDGVGIAVVQHQTQKKIDVAISDGTINGHTALYQNDTECNGAEHVKNITINVNGGTFTAINGGTNAVFSADKRLTITGGTFSSNPSAYIASGYEVVPSGDKYLVQKYVDRSSSSSSSATDTGSGNFAEYPRQADGTAGEIDFGSSKDVKSVDLPEGVTGEVKLIAKSSHPAPEGKDTHKVFEINIPNYPTGKPATIKFEMTLAEIEAKGLTAADVCLYHFDKETGIWTKLPTTYKVVDGKVYFEAVTTGFSPFAIVFEEGAATPVEGADEPVTPPTETPDVSGEDLPEIQDEPTEVLPPAADEPADEPTESPLPILAVLAGLGAAVVLRRK